MPPWKLAPFDAELNSTPNPSGFRDNPSNIANPATKYLKKPFGQAVFGGEVALFAR
jgi:hypothetical protein